MIRLSPILLITFLFFSNCNEPSKKRDFQTGANGDSVQVNYFDNGTRSDETSIKNGVPNGPYTSYYQNGSIKETGLLINGRKGTIWKIFDSSNKLLRVQHFDDDKVIFDLPVDDFTFERKSNDKAGFSIKLPRSWITAFSDSSALMTSHKNCDSGVFCPNIIITKGLMTTNSFTSFGDTIKRTLMSHFNGCRIVTERQFEIDKKPSYQAAFMFEAENRQLAGVVTVIQHQTEVYNIISMAGNEPSGSFLKYKGLFEEIAYSFRFN
ncbi:MAG TPA: hypothetical protein VK518_07775 [Puia sp.]|nr:hypothetical protein [Puia sp.]